MVVVANEVVGSLRAGTHRTNGAVAAATGVLRHTTTFHNRITTRNTGYALAVDVDLVVCDDASTLAVVRVWNFVFLRSSRSLLMACRKLLRFQTTGQVSTTSPHPLRGRSAAGVGRSRFGAVRRDIEYFIA